MLSGYVCLIGAGPGDPGLITRLGLGYLRRADVVLYDQLAPIQLVLETPTGCERINVGKRCGKPSTAQEEINRLLIEKAQAGKFVVRLKGGDPFLFGRGCEEAEALVQAGIPYILVPGISSSLSIPAAAGIPVTHRQIAHSVMIRSGRRSDPDKQEGRPTQVVLMSLTSLAEISATLMGEGYPPATPAAVISRGATPFQQVLVGTLENIVSLTKKADLPAPALLVAGEAAALASTMNWKGNLPLNGTRILWTRPESQEDTTYLEELELLGAEVARLPLFTVHPAPQSELAAVLPELAKYSWLVFTSPNAVQIFFDMMLVDGKDWSYFASSRIAAVGPKTAAALRQRGRNPDQVAPQGNSRNLFQIIKAALHPGDRVALCQAEKTLPYLAEGLSRSGVDYHQFVLYHLEYPEYPDDLIRLFFKDPFDLVVFTAPAAVARYFEMLESHRLKPEDNTRYVCLGRETEAQLARWGYPAWLVPEQPRLEDLIQQIIQKLRSEPIVSNHSPAPSASNSAFA